jgi:ATP sulfurylase
MSDVEQSSTSKIEQLLYEEAKRDLEMEYQGAPPVVGEMQRLSPEGYKATREFLLTMSADMILMALSIQQAERISEMIHSEDEGLSAIQDVLNMQPVNALTLAHLIHLERTRTANKGADAKHNKPGGSREKCEKMRKIWASGKYRTKAECAEKEHTKLAMKFESARNALKGEPSPPGRC